MYIYVLSLSGQESEGGRCSASKAQPRVHLRTLILLFPCSNSPSSSSRPLPPLPLEFARVEQMLTPFILRRTSSASPPSLASSTAPSLASTDHAEADGGEAGQGGREERLRHVAAVEEEERKEKKAMDLGQLVRVCDMRLPHDWYPYARLMRRKIVYHGGGGGIEGGRDEPLRYLTYPLLSHTREGRAADVLRKLREGNGRQTRRQ